MSENTQEKENLKLDKISVGIRHRRSFRIPEIAGSVIDYILADKNSPFGDKFFVASDTILDNFENKGRVLIAENDSSIVVDTDSFILNLKSKDLRKDLDKIKDEIIPFFKKIFKEFGIKNIDRIGLVFEFKEKKSDTINKIIENITNNNFSNLDRFNLRFAEKETDMKSAVKKELLDYANKIVSIVKTEKGIFVKFDYQFYFSPEISNIEDVDFDKFFETAEDKLNRKLFNWYKTNEKEKQSK